jgi:UDP-N-acetylmuramyl pentapeptide phosphotransferase/UDP-N-acetylglucosamine-1-phosphate transferase
MTAFLDPRWWGSICASFLLSAFVTWLSIRYAQQRNLLDLPGQRRSHMLPTPRGGGIGIVVAVLGFFCVPLLLSAHAGDQAFGLAVAIPLLLVAVVGWVDDHRPLSARVRILVHFAAALTLWLVPMLWGLGLYGVHGSGVAIWIARDWPYVFITAILIVWSINLHNFMDGINGLLACQAVFVFAALGMVCRGTPEHMSQLFVLGAATFGFLPFNFPRARVFMGDVGSGSLGLLIAIAVGIAINVGTDVAAPRPVVLSGAIAASGFLTDATCTLLSRMLRGRRWYSAHREHLYQCMTRAGMSHTRVVAWYMGWNLAVVAPVLWWINRESPQGLDHGGEISVSGTECMWTAILYTAAVALWIFGKRWCLHKVKSGSVREHA